MKLRFYLRGLGFGIIVTALIMGIAQGHRSGMTDDQIRAEALKLGMVDGGTVLSGLIADDGRKQTSEEAEGDLSGKGQSGEEQPQKVQSQVIRPKEEASQDSAPQGQSSQASSSEDQSSIEHPAEEQSSQEISSKEQSSQELSVQENPSRDGASEDTSGQESRESGQDAETITFTIQRGASSEVVSRNLEKEGLIDDASGFNSYLVNNGYSRVISVGTYQIPSNASWNEIAEIITRRR